MFSLAKSQSKEREGEARGEERPRTAQRECDFKGNREFERRRSEKLLAREAASSRCRDVALFIESPAVIFLLSSHPPPLFFVIPFVSSSVYLPTFFPHPATRTDSRKNNDSKIFAYKHSQMNSREALIRYAGKVNNNGSTRAFVISTINAAPFLTQNQVIKKILCYFFFFNNIM